MSMKRFSLSFLSILLDIRIAKPSYLLAAFIGIPLSILSLQDGVYLWLWSFEGDMSPIVLDI